jgi:hypothetical protein
VVLQVFLAERHLLAGAAAVQTVWHLLVLEMAVLQPYGFSIKEAMS